MGPFHLTLIPRHTVNSTVFLMLPKSSGKTSGLPVLAYVTDRSCDRDLPGVKGKCSCNANSFPFCLCIESSHNHVLFGFISEGNAGDFLSLAH